MNKYSLTLARIFVAAIFIGECGSSIANAQSDDALTGAREAFAEFRDSAVSESVPCAKMLDYIHTAPLPASTAGETELANISYACIRAVFREVDPGHTDFSQANRAAQVPLFVNLETCNWLQNHAPSRYRALGHICNP